MACMLNTLSLAWFGRWDHRIEGKSPSNKRLKPTAHWRVDALIVANQRSGAAA